MPNPGLIKRLLVNRAEDVFPGPPPALHLQADRITGIADGGAIATWPDISGNARDFTQGTGANQPIFKTNIQNGHACVRFVSSDSMTNSTMPLTQNWTVFLVFSSPNNLVQFMFYWGTSSDGFGIFISADRSVQLRSGGGTTNCTDANYPASSTVESWSVRRNNTGPLLELWKNSVSQTLTNSTAAQGATTAAAIVGAFNPAAPAVFFPGDMFELIAYDYVLPDATRSVIEKYLQKKYNLTP